MNWTTVCKQEDLTSGTGLCALHNYEQVAIFYCGRTESLYAISNYDPIGNAYVLSRGLMGSVGEEPVMISPLYKQRYNLETGVCLDDEETKIKTYDVRIENGEVQLAA